MRLVKICVILTLLTLLISCGNSNRPDPQHPTPSNDIQNGIRG